MIAICSPIHCYCQHYDTDHAGLIHTAKQADKTVSLFRTAADLATLVVAHLHTITPNQAEKLRKTPL
ncbi:MAG: hypothetical protein L0H94_06830 [Nitrospira sp.]|nr:hypothetical protein [Nitrospira sp.]